MDNTIEVPVTTPDKPSFEETINNFKDRMMAFVDRTKGIATMPFPLRNSANHQLTAKQRKERAAKQKSQKAARKRNRR